MPLYIVMYKSKCQAIVLPNKNKLQAYSDRIFKKNIENGYFHQSDSCHDIVVLSIRLKSRHHKFSHYTINAYEYVGKPHRIP